MTISYSRRFLIVAFVLAVFALTPLVTMAGGGGSGVRSNTTAGPDSAFGSLTNTNTQASVCTADAKLCPDGSYVGRTGPSCQFAACPTGNGTSTPPTSTSTSQIRCTQDAMICPNGRSVGRVAPSCNFAACPTTVNAPAPASDAISCPQDAKICPDGTAVGRVAPSCNFAACPTGLPGSDTNGTPGAVGDSGTYIPPLFGGGGNTSASGMTNDTNTGNNSAFCPMDAKMCPDGSFVGRTRPSCQFAACPTSTSTSTSTPSDNNPVCPMDAKRCPGGTFVGRTGPSCTFAACPVVPTATSSNATDSGAATGWNWPAFAFPGASNSGNNAGTDSGVLNPFINNVVAPVASALTTAINPAFNMFSTAAEFGYDSVASNNQNNTNNPAFVNFGAITMPTFDSSNVNNRPRSTSTLQTLLDRIYRRNQTTSTTTSNIPGSSGDSILGGGGTKPNKTNTIAFEVKVTKSNGDIITNWSTSTVAEIPAGGEIRIRWTASDYAQCLPFLNDNGKYALQAADRTMTVGNTEREGYDVPEVTGIYRIECGGQKNGESGVDQRSVKVTGAGAVVPPLFGGGVTGGSDGTVSNTDPFGGTSNNGAICTQEAKRCPDGSYVSRTGPHCEFAACPASIVDISQINTFMECANAGYPVSESNPPTCRLPDGRTFTGATYVVDPPVGGTCTQEAKRCPDGSYVTRTGPHCEFAACPAATNTGQTQ